MATWNRYISTSRPLLPLIVCSVALTGIALSITGVDSILGPSREGRLLGLHHYFAIQFASIAIGGLILAMLGSRQNLSLAALARVDIDVTFDIAGPDQSSILLGGTTGLTSSPETTPDETNSEGRSTGTTHSDGGTEYDLISQDAISELSRKASPVRDDDSSSEEETLDTADTVRISSEGEIFDLPSTVTEYSTLYCLYSILLALVYSLVLVVQQETTLAGVVAVLTGVSAVAAVKLNALSSARVWFSSTEVPIAAVLRTTVSRRSYTAWQFYLWTVTVLAFLAAFAALATDHPIFMFGVMPASLAPIAIAVLGANADWSDRAMILGIISGFAVLIGLAVPLAIVTGMVLLFATFSYNEELYPDFDELQDEIASQDSDGEGMAPSRTEPE